MELYIAIDTSNMRFIAQADQRVLSGLVYIQYPHVNTYLAPADETRTYSKFSHAELKLLYVNTTGFQHEGTDYNALLQSCRALGLQAPSCEIPLHVLEAQIHSIDHRDEEPRTAMKDFPVAKVKPAVAKAERSPSDPSPRPKAGTSTGLVWDIADKVLDEMGGDISAQVLDQKALRKVIIERATAQGINPATVQVQFSKWKASK